jgi:large subunit ribosomal protein L10
MSKQIKQMEMDALGQSFQGVRDLVALTITGLDSKADNQVRLNLRKKNIRLQVVKNSLARRVLGGLGVNAENIWAGPTTLAWGGTSLAELSRELDEVRRKYEKFIKPKGAIADGQEVTFEQALKMPTRPEAIGRVVMLALAPASRLLSQILGPASQVAGQIKTLREKTEGEKAEGEKPAEAPAAPPA